MGIWMWNTALRELCNSSVWGQLGIFNVDPSHVNASVWLLLRTIPSFVLHSLLILLCSVRLCPMLFHVALLVHSFLHWHSTLVGYADGYLRLGSGILIHRTYIHTVRASLFMLTLNPLSAHVSWVLPWFHMMKHVTVVSRMGFPTKG